MSEEKKLDQSEITTKKEEKKQEQEQEMESSPKTKLMPSLKESLTESAKDPSEQVKSGIKNLSQTSQDSKKEDQKDDSKKGQKEAGYGIYLKRTESEDSKKDGILSIGPLPGMTRDPKQWQMMAMIREILSIMQNGDTARAVIFTMVEGQRAAQKAAQETALMNKVRGGVLKPGK